MAFDVLGSRGLGPAEFPLIETLGLRPVINALGAPTRLGCCRYPEPVVRAMLEAMQSFVPINELQGRASQAIAKLTGAESGCVTTGAAAALFLGTCAILAGNDLGAMERLPETGDRPNEMVVHRTHRSPYDHAVRAAGASLVEFGYAWEGVGAYPWQLEAAIGPRTAGVLFFTYAEDQGLPLEEVCRIAHSASVPVLVDAAEEPTVGRLRQVIDDGPDLIAVCGGKALRGPAGSGFLAGRADLVVSATMQHQDMYTTPELFSGPFGTPHPTLTGPGHHGMGRILKLGREEIVGLIAAIELFMTADRDADAERYAARLALIDRAIADHPAVRAEVLRPTRESMPFMRVRFLRADGRDDAVAVARRLLNEDPRIFIDDGRLRFGEILIGPGQLTDEEAGIVGARLAAALAEVTD